MIAVDSVERTQLTTRPAIKPGDTVRVHVKVREGDKERIQVFEGMVIGMHRGGARATFTVRKVSFGQGVERIFPLHSPIIDKIDVVRTAQVRRAKLYFLRELKGKAARMKERKKPTRLGARLGARRMAKVRAFRTHGERHPANGVRLRGGGGRSGPRLPGRARRRGGGGVQSRPLRAPHRRLEDRHRARAGRSSTTGSPGPRSPGASPPLPATRSTPSTSIRRPCARCSGRSSSWRRRPDFVLVDAFRIPGPAHGPAGGHPRGQPAARRSPPPRSSPR